MPLELVELFTAPARDDVVSERRAAIDRAANDADLATIAGFASTAEAESWLLEEARRRLAAESILERGKGLMLAALLGITRDDFGDMIDKSKAPRTWLKASLDALERLRRRTNWVHRRITDTQTFRGERAYLVLRGARPFMHAALQAHIDHALIDNDEWRALERPLDRLKRDADKTQKDWEKTLLTMKIDHRLVRFPS